MKTILHILTKPMISEIMLCPNPEHGFVLMQDAVYLLLEELQLAMQNNKIYVLQDDYTARISTKVQIQITPNIQFINYINLVDLCCEYNSTVCL